MCVYVCMKFGFGLSTCRIQEEFWRKGDGGCGGLVEGGGYGV